MAALLNPYIKYHSFSKGVTGDGLLTGGINPPPHHFSGVRPYKGGGTAFQTIHIIDYDMCVISKLEHCSENMIKKRNV